jgi:hypothetical protein
VHSESGSGAGDAVAGLKVNDALADPNDRTRAAVAGALGLVETAAHRLNRRNDSIALDFADHVAN